MNNSSNNSEPLIEGRPNKAASFFSVFAGWVMAFATWIVHQVHGDGFGYITDFSFMLIWPALFTFIGWLAFILPLMAFRRSREFLFSPRVAWAAWASVALVSYMLLVMTWIPDALFLAWFPAIVGVVAGLIFPRIAHLKIHRVIWMITPFLLCLLFTFIVWPAAERISPYLTYTYGTFLAKTRSMQRIFERISVGDDYLSLSNDYPRIFDGKATGFSASSQGSDGSFRYGIDVDPNTHKVTKVYFTVEK